MSTAKKLYRNPSEGKLFGVCAGLADYFSLDVTLVRLLMVVFALTAGTGILFYLLATLVMPVSKDKSA